MFLIQHHNATDPAINLALEEYCLRYLDPGSEYLLFYINRPTVIIGRHQNPFQELNHQLARQYGIPAVRRITGGGAVYHDPGNLNFSFITDFGVEKLDYFKTLIQPILSTLQRLGAPARLTEKNDIRVADQKVSGNSQHTNMRRMLSHGTLLFDANLEMLQRVLASNLVITRSRAVSSIQSEVANITGHLRRPIGLDTFRAELVDGISEVFGDLMEYRLTASDWEAVDLLAQNKYKTWEWTYGRSPEFDVHHSIKCESETVDVHFTVKNGIIESFELTNQSTVSAPAHAVISKLIGKRYDLALTDDLAGI